MSGGIWGAVYRFPKELTNPARWRLDVTPHIWTLVGCDDGGMCADELAGRDSGLVISICVGGS